MQREIDELPGADAERHLEPVPQLARAAAHLGHIDGQHQRAVAGRAGALDQLHGAAAIAAEIKLKPGHAARGLEQGFHVGRSHGRDAMRHPVPRRQPRQHQIGVGGGQVAHAHRADAKGAHRQLVEQLHPQLSPADVAQHPRRQADVLNGPARQHRAMLLAGRAVDIVEHHPGQAFACQPAGVLAGMNTGLAQHDLSSLCGAAGGTRPSAAPSPCRVRGEQHGRRSCPGNSR